MGKFRRAWSQFPEREAAVLSAICFWVTSWAFYSLDDGHFSPVGDSFTVAWLVFIVVMGVLMGLRGYRSKDSMTHYIVILGAVLAALLFAVAVKHPDGFLEVQIGIIASLIVALASTKERKPRHRIRRTAKAKGNSQRPLGPARSQKRFRPAVRE